METKIMQIFYDNNALPYKDKERQVHYPITGQSFSGASLTTEIRFYTKEIGGVDGITWVANAKRPDGKIAYQQLTSNYDSEVEESYVSLQLSQWFTEKKGDLFIALNGYAGGVDIEVDEDSGLYTVSGTPIIQTTGSIKVIIAYAPIMNNGYGAIPEITVQQALGAVSSKLDKNSTKYIKVLDSLAEINSSSNSEYLNGGDIIAVRDDGNSRFELFELDGTYPNFEANELSIYIEYGYFNDLIANSATFSETDNVMFADINESLSWLLYQKADKSDTYTKEQVNTFGKSIELTMDSDYKLYLTLKDANGNVLGTTQVVDLPLESVVVGGSYDSVNKALMLTLDNGNTIIIPVGDLISGLVSEEQLETALEEKQDTLVSGENIKTINGTTLLGNGNYAFDIAFDENSTNALQNKIISREVREINYQLAVIREELFESVLTEIDYTVDFATLYAIPDTLSDDDGSHRVVYSETELKRIDGNTIVENQLVVNGNFADTSNWQGVNGTINISNNKCLYTQTSQDGSTNSQIYQPLSCIVGHKYLISVELKTNKTYTNKGICVRVGGLATWNNNFVENIKQKIATIFTATSSGEYYVIFASNGVIEVNDTIEASNAQLIDITQMFPINTPTTLDDPRVQWLLSRGYIAYNKGSLLSGTYSGIKVNGYNLFDGEIELGWINSAGVLTTNTNTWRSKNYTEVVGGFEYTLSSALSGYTNMYVYQYDKDKTLIKYSGSIGSTSISYYSITLENETKYIKFAYYKNGANFTNNLPPLSETQLCLHRTGTRTGYAPYILPTTISVPTTELKSAGNVHNYIEVVEGNVVEGEQLYNLVKHTLVGSVDLESLSFGGTGNIVYYATLSNTKNNTGLDNYPNILCGNYETVVAKSNNYWVNTETRDKIISLGYDTNRVYVRDTSITQASDIRGILYYELATPTEEVIATNLRFDEISSLIEQGGSIEPIYTNVPPNIKTTFVVKKAVGE